MYEIVPVDPVSKLQKKHLSLEDDIKEIKNALRGTVGLSKLETNADGFIQKMLGLMESSQKMVEQVAESNHAVASKIQEAIDHMNHANEELSAKLSKVVTFFAQATESLGGDESSDDTLDAINNLKSSIDTMNANNTKIAKLLSSAGRPVQRRMPMRQLPPPTGIPRGPPAAPQGAPPAPPAPGQVNRQQGSAELPPPPFPP
ncbi:MAG: hypothetical protein QF475_03580 [Candidatus Undinarchaeales archaeon]|nr:hypothetical protein [Candidatus Undinarchaeales archaeon]